MDQSRQPFFTIGIPTYNREGLLKESIQSCLWQTFADFELIVANDFPDAPLTPERLVVNDPRVRVINHPKNLGAIGNMNALIPMARGKYFVWLSDDDMFMPDFLETVHRALKCHGQASCVYTSYTEGADYPRDVKICLLNGELLKGQDFLKLYLQQRYKIQGWYGIFETAFFQKLGGMHQLGSAWYSPYSDLLIPIKAAAASDVIVVDWPLIFYRVHAESISITSTDGEAYSSSQIALLEAVKDILASGPQAKDFDDNLYHLLRRFVREYLDVTRRSGKVRMREIIAYLKLLKLYSQKLKKNKLRYRTMVLKNVLALFKNHILRKESYAKH